VVTQLAVSLISSNTGQYGPIIARETSWAVYGAREMVADLKGRCLSFSVRFMYSLNYLYICNRKGQERAVEYFADLKEGLWIHLLHERLPL
jgi:hypothetical protein